MLLVPPIDKSPRAFFEEKRSFSLREQSLFRYNQQLMGESGMLALIRTFRILNTPKYSMRSGLPSLPRELQDMIIYLTLGLGYLRIKPFGSAAWLRRCSIHAYDPTRYDPKRYDPKPPEALALSIARCRRLR